jgi:hypothetical protein
MAGARSVEIGRPSEPIRSAARNPVSPGPAASSRIVAPGRGRTCSTTQSRREAESFEDVLAVSVPSRAEPVPELERGLGRVVIGRGQAGRSALSSAAFSRRILRWAAASNSLSSVA